MKFSEFLETVAPHVEKPVEDYSRVEGPLVLSNLGLGGAARRLLARPDIRVECRVCEGVRRFEAVSGPRDDSLQVTNLHFMVYACADCTKERRFIAVTLGGSVGSPTINAMKVGEYPPFGERVPNRVLKLFGNDKHLMLKGRTAENQGLGIGAFAYYRLAVERNKDEILKALRAAAERLGARPEVLAVFDDALREHSFTAALDAVTLPESLEVSGQNPFKLLHATLSKGLHPELTDEQCLELARWVRLLLADMVHQVQLVLEDRREVEEAVRQLLKAQASDEPPDDSER